MKDVILRTDLLRDVSGSQKASWESLSSFLENVACTGEQKRDTVNR